jgi:hypothetical protein
MFSSISSSIADAIFSINNWGGDLYKSCQNHPKISLKMATAVFARTLEETSTLYAAYS